MQRFLDAITPGRLRPLDSPGRWWLAVLAIPAAGLVSAFAHLLSAAAPPLSPFYLAVIVVAALGGAGPGLLTLGLTVLYIVALGATLYAQQWQVFTTEPVPLPRFELG